MRPALSMKLESALCMNPPFVERPVAGDIEGTLGIYYRSGGGKRQSACGALKPRVVM